MLLVAAQSFDELLLLKRGGRIIFFGSLGERSQDLVDYLQVCKKHHYLTLRMQNVCGVQNVMSATSIHL
jgi:hypothetical protein